MKLKELQIYNQSMVMAEKIWSMVIAWDYFSKDTIRKQLVKAADSIAANLSEGYGRYHYRENKNFCYYSRGSLFKTKTWITKAYNGKLVDSSDFESLIKQMDDTGTRLNNYIASIGNTK
jgi:four helix bundle protein